MPWKYIIKWKYSREGNERKSIEWFKSLVNRSSDSACSKLLYKESCRDLKIHHFSLQAPVSELVCHTVGNHDYQGVPIIMLSPLYPVAFPFRPLRNNQPVFFAAGTGKLPVPYPYAEKVYLRWSNRRPWRLCNLRVQKRAFNR